MNSFEERRFISRKENIEKHIYAFHNLNLKSKLNLKQKRFLINDVDTN